MCIIPTNPWRLTRPHLPPTCPFYPPPVYVDPCGGCPWRNKPYWSIVSPCEGCYGSSSTGTFTPNITVTYSTVTEE